MPSDLPDLHVGDHVHDRDSADPAPMLVVGTPPAQADKHVVDGEGKQAATVADYNEDYPDDDDAVQVVFAERTFVDLDHARTYAYPRSRLELDQPIHDIEEDN
ncbi:hypothetical protein [Haloarcula laminariae]|uniref:hypothetical protein n=1 Tax=Haloarcula laminariae TaxID=2961577 RepID=UPI0024055DA2|nr:hypothetical protein [Halomicroarcula sp. FL173]